MTALSSRRVYRQCCLCSRSRRLCIYHFNKKRERPKRCSLLTFYRLYRTIFPVIRQGNFWGCSRFNLAYYIKRFHENPSTSFAGPPPLKGRLFYIQAPLGFLGSPLGELAPQVTEGCFRDTSHIKQKISHRNPSTVCDGSPPFSREAFISRLPFRAPEGRALC